MSTNTITPAQALQWLAGLKKPCPRCGGHGLTFNHFHGIPFDCEVCDGSGQVPVLDLRKPCPRIRGKYSWPTIPDIHEMSGINCICGGTGSVPKQGETALHAAMHKDGWGVFTEWPPGGGYNCIFAKEGQLFEDADASVAAVKAMKAAGYE